jgi:hypothetical protein
MLETMAATTTFVKCGTISSNSGQSNASDPLLWDCQQFPDSNTKFSPIKQEIMDTYDIAMPQSDFTELKPMPFDYGSSLTGIDPVLSNNNNNNSSNNNNNNQPERKVMDQHLNIYIKPLSPPTPPNRESFCFNQSPSDVTSSGSISPPGIIKIDYPTSQDAFDDIANIVGISMGADSTVPTLENDIDLDAWIENTASNIKPLGQDNSYESILPTSSESNSITNISMTSTQPYLTPLPGSALANLLTQANSKGPRVTSLEQRETFPPILSPILRSQLTGYQGTYPVIKQETYDGGVMKQEYYSNEQMPHSTVGSMVDHRRLGLDSLGRNKPKPPKPRPRLLGNGGGGCQSDQGKKMMHHCQICNRGFLNKSNIKVHLRTHTGEKPFGCEHCSKAFRQKAHLLKHMSIHKRISRD